MYQFTKLGDLKNLLYSCAQSPLVLQVIWGPLDSRDFTKSSELNGLTFGGALYGDMDLASGINPAKYLSRGIINICVNSKKWRLSSAVCSLFN